MTWKLAMAEVVEGFQGERRRPDVQAAGQRGHLHHQADKGGHLHQVVLCFHERITKDKMMNFAEDKN